MIYVVSGKLGGGKSLYCAYIAALHMSKGYIVASNCHYDLEKMSFLVGRHISPCQLMSIGLLENPSEIPMGDPRGQNGQRKVMVIIDEALNWFSSNGTGLDSRKQVWGEWLRQSDKMGQDVYLIAQHLPLLAKWIRDLAHTLIFCQDLRHNKLWHLFPYPPPLNNCIAASYHIIATQEWYRSVLIRKRKSVFGLYKTAEMFGAIDLTQYKSAYAGLAIFPPSKLPKASLIPIFGIGIVFVFLLLPLGNKQQKIKYLDKVQINYQQRSSNATSN